MSDDEPRSIRYRLEVFYYRHALTVVGVCAAVSLTALAIFLAITE